MKRIQNFRTHTILALTLSKESRETKCETLHEHYNDRNDKILPHICTTLLAQCYWHHSNTLIPNFFYVTNDLLIIDFYTGCYIMYITPRCDVI